MRINVFKQNFAHNFTDRFLGALYVRIWNFAEFNLDFILFHNVQFTYPRYCLTLPPLDLDLTQVNVKNTFEFYKKKNHALSCIIFNVILFEYY